VTIGAIERAIELNGVAVDANLAAFGWGRRWAHDPAAVEGVAEVAKQSDPDATAIVTVPTVSKQLSDRITSLAADTRFRETLSMLTADLAGFQDEKYARRFLDVVASTRVAERAIAVDSHRLTEAVARSLHKLMAYKDEYEVARLMLLPEATAAARSAGGADARITWQLHPPMLKALGRQSKVAFRSWTRPAFTALRACKRLRGTRLDPFGWTEMRRMEQALPDEFVDALDTVLRSLSAENLDEAVAIAELPDVVRGYEDLKVRRVGEYRERLTAALLAFPASRPDQA